MSDEYSYLAPIYQKLSQVVFGSHILNANRAFLGENLSQKLVIIGGGDGMAYQHFGASLAGWYFEKSAKMLELAQKKLKNSRLQFVHGEFPGEVEADCFFLPVVLDCLSDQEILKLLGKIRSCISEKGILVFSDFFPSKTRKQKLLLGLMISFFRLFTQHIRKDLPDYSALLQQSGFRFLEEKRWKKGWIRTQVYELAD